jgi:leucyl aminopeptidase
MTTPVSITCHPTDLETLATYPGRISILAGAGGASGPAARRVNRLTRGALDRFLASPAFARLKPGEAADLGWPAGMAAEALQVVKLDRTADIVTARKAGAAIGRTLGPAGALVVAEGHPKAAEVAFGLSLRAYDFTPYRTTEVKLPGEVTLMVTNPETIAAQTAPKAALAEGVFFTRDLTNEPGNVLTPEDFANRLTALRDLGLKVEVMEEDEMRRLGMNALLGVGQGSVNRSKIVVMQWNGGPKDEPPFAVIGKGVTFDTGGISIKPAGGMEDMTGDMGGAGVVAGLMRALALRKSKANVVGLVGLVENMPDGNAQRPGDVVKSMKGDTIEVINTDAEGRLVLADVFWYAQDRFNPSGMIDLATLTGAMVVALGHENTGVFSNDDTLCNALLKAARAEGEGAWRMPMGDGYDALLKSRIADMKNVTGREGGAITAAQFLQRFVKPGLPWCHLDIAGTASVKTDTAFAPKGATGWGVMTLDRLIRDMFEG